MAKVTEIKFLDKLLQKTTNYFKIKDQVTIIM